MTKAVKQGRRAKPVLQRSDAPVRTMVERGAEVVLLALLGEGIFFANPSVEKVLGHAT
jgi:hypothetical protein